MYSSNKSKSIDRKEWFLCHITDVNQVLHGNISVIKKVRNKKGASESFILISVERSFRLKQFSKPLLIMDERIPTQSPFSSSGAFDHIT